LPLEPGTTVYQDQSMFLIPDLSRLEVDVSVHETMGPRVRVGMKAKVRIASRPAHVIPGQVVAIEMLSNPNWKVWDDNVRHFIARVRLDETPASALVFMSATVEIDTGRVAGALVIPVEALSVVGGHDSCYVVGDGGVERRSIKTRRATRDLLEVTAGLQEGERVVSRSLDVADEIAVVDKTYAPAGNIARDQPVSPRSPESSSRSTSRTQDGSRDRSGDRSTS
jgi:HlyD family secretion protein